MRAFIVLIFSVLLSFPIGIVNAQSVTNSLPMTATILPLSEDAHVTLSSNVTGTVLSQDQEVTFTITYDKLIHDDFPLVITTKWQKGLVEGTDDNYIDILDYVYGSATLSDDGAVPVVDLLNNSITWTVHPSQAVPHTVTYKLKVKTEIPTVKKISAVVSVAATFTNAEITGNSLTMIIQKYLAPTAAPTSIPITPIPPTTAPNITSVPTSIPTPLPATKIVPSISSISFDSINATSAELTFISSPETTYVLHYSKTLSLKSADALTSLDFQKKHRVLFSDLTPSTQYFFTLRITTKETTSVSSDIFTFTTPAQTTKVTVPDGNISFHAQNIELSPANVVLPQDVPLNVVIKIDNSEDVVNVSAAFGNAKVLGINVFAEELPIQEVNLVEIAPHIFSGGFVPTNVLGEYSLEFKIKTTQGNLITRKATQRFFISKPLTVLNSVNGKPVENAKVVISRYQESSGKFTMLNKKFTKDYLTDENGVTLATLPQGRYRIEVKVAGYDYFRQDLELGISTNKYPTLQLKANASLLATIIYYRNSASDLKNLCVDQVQNIFSSHRAKDIFVLMLFLELVTLISAYMYLNLNKHKAILNGIFEVFLAFISFDWLLFNIFCTLLFTSSLGIKESWIQVLIIGVQAIFWKKVFENYLKNINKEN